MTYTATTLQQSSVIGIAVTTTNKDGQAQNDIAGLWQKFFRESVIDHIPGKASHRIYCVYTD